MYLQDEEQAAAEEVAGDGARRVRVHAWAGAGAGAGRHAVLAAVVHELLLHQPPRLPAARHLRHLLVCCLRFACNVLFDAAVCEAAVFFFPSPAVS